MTKYKKGSVWLVDGKETYIATKDSDTRSGAKFELITNKKQLFYITNKDIFLKYFDSEQQYEAMIRAGNFAKMSETIKANTAFDFEEFVEWVRS